MNPPWEQPITLGEQAPPQTCYHPKLGNWACHIPRWNRPWIIHDMGWVSDFFLWQIFCPFFEKYIEKKNIIFTNSPIFWPKNCKKNKLLERLPRIATIAYYRKGCIRFSTFIFWTMQNLPKYTRGWLPLQSWPTKMKKQNIGWGTGILLFLSPWILLFPTLIVPLNSDFFGQILLLSFFLKIVFLVQIWLFFAKKLPNFWFQEIGKKKRKAWPSPDLILMPYQSRFLWLLKVFEAWCTRGITMKTHN
jgi:hypothetical protein